MTACLEIASQLANSTESEVTDHLATCPSCRATAVAVWIVRDLRAGAPDLWGRVRARLQQRDEVVVRLPRIDWQAAAALVAVSATAALAPEPGRLLAVLLGMM